MRINVLEIIDLEITLNKRFKDGTLSSEVLDDLNAFFRRYTKHPSFKKHGLDSRFTAAVQTVAPWERKRKTNG